MSAGLTIRADGVEWPLATFIDSYGFTRTDGERRASVRLRSSRSKSSRAAQ